MKSSDPACGALLLLELLRPLLPLVEVPESRECTLPFLLPLEFDKLKGKATGVGQHPGAPDPGPDKVGFNTAPGVG